MVHMDLREKAAAKVNLSLLVGPMRPDGYHELLSVFVPIDLYDDLALSLTPGPAAEIPGELEVVCPGVAGENLVTRALRAVEAAGGVSIRGKVHVCKGIPIGAGLGGGSADAAAAVRAAATALEEERHMRLGADTVRRLARSLGADVPFFLEGRPAIGRGIGDLLEPLVLPALHLVLVLWDGPLSTAAAYAEFDREGPLEAEDEFSIRAAGLEGEWRRLAEAWESGGMSTRECATAASQLLRNDLEAASFRLIPELAEAKRAITEAGASGALMSGSGPTLFGVCASSEEAESVRGRLDERGYRATVVTVRAGPGGLPRPS